MPSLLQKFNSHLSPPWPAWPDMEKLREVYNPFSDSVLTLYRDPAANRYGVGRRIRRVPGKILGMVWSESIEEALKVFEKKLIDECNDDILKLDGKSRDLEAAKPNTPIFSTRLSGSAPFGIRLIADSDPQAETLYRVETDFIMPKARRINIAEGQSIIDEQQKEHGFTAFEFVHAEKFPFPFNLLNATLNKGRGLALNSEAFKKLIITKTENMHMHILCHEIAHSITRTHFPKDVPSHGVHFAKVSAQLYIHYIGIDPGALVEVYNKAGLFGPKPVSLESVMSPLIDVKRNQVSLEPALI